MDKAGNTRGLYLAFHDVKPSAGVSQKILNQVESFKSNGTEMFLLSYREKNGIRTAFIDEKEIKPLFNGLRCVIREITMYPKIISFIKENSINFLFIRYTQRIDFFYLKFLKECKKMGITILLEIPTFPYDGEFSSQSILYKTQIYIERFFRTFLKNYVDYIVTTSEFENILGIKTIRISNAVNPDLIPVKNENRSTADDITFISVATISFWHGLDRLIKGIYDYLKNKPHKVIKLLIVGGGDPNEINKLKRMICEYNLGEHIQYLGPKYGKDLDVLYEKADIAVGCLGCHRKNIEEVKSLKNVEYAMRGLPFFYSERNTDFDGRPYVFKVPADDSDIKVSEVLNFYKSKKWDSSAIRQSVSDLTWDNQINKIVLSLS